MAVRLAAGVRESDGQRRILPIRRGVRGQRPGVQEARALGGDIRERRDLFREAGLPEAVVGRELLPAAAERGDAGLRGREDELAADLGAAECQAAQPAELLERVLRAAEVRRRGDERDLAAAARVDGGLTLEDRVESGREDR